MIRVKLIFNGVGTSGDSVRKGLSAILAELEKEFKVQKYKIGVPEKVTSVNYFSFLEVITEFERLEDVFEIVVSREPVLVEILEPEEILSSRKEVENCLNRLIEKNCTDAKIIKSLTEATVALRRKLEQVSTGKV
ncbi:MAG: hypothetical protein QW507_01160 [Candidatus Nanoarchaeia archaeon]|nr:hypothetical protein [Candidatus Haiyanarchaeum thermophilum]MCW1303889.1 hypothetical protein [Candidatus Haiyanarchaeum thermophilum]MCW1306874.1 hypothetical protein [Candidatus Haiyanarchaeum thermophilum]MCW1307450.1 hypothetical protein [Candidatus Haiyanarchaeum thermophilum]MCW1308255.1 hypothetical protein [Candidatus Haiyanarchaeum thermophilum]